MVIVAYHLAFSVLSLLILFNHKYIQASIFCSYEISYVARYVNSYPYVHHFECALGDKEFKILAWVSKCLLPMRQLEVAVRISLPIFFIRKRKKDNNIYCLEERVKTSFSEGGDNFTPSEIPMNDLGIWVKHSCLNHS